MGYPRSHLFDLKLYKYKLINIFIRKAAFLQIKYMYVFQENIRVIINNSVKAVFVVRDKKDI